MLVTFDPELSYKKKKLQPEKESYGIYSKLYGL